MIVNHSNGYFVSYTARQLCVITPPVRPVFFSQPVENYIISPGCPLQFSKDYPFCTAPISSFLKSADLSSCPKRQRVAYVSHTFICVLSLCINCNLRTKWLSCQPISNLEFLNSGRGLSRGEISRNTGVSQGGISRVFRPVRETGRAVQRPHRLRMTTSREDRALIWIMRRNRFPPSWRIRVELIRRTGRRVSARTVQRRLVAAGYCSRRPARWQTDSWSSPPTLRMGTTAPELEWSALVSCWLV